MEYRGITRETLFLMSDNRFRDSKDFYEEHKEELKSGITEPMREIAGIIGSELSSLDPLMCTIPTKMVSRIRRDTRFTKDKRLYRDNMWIMFTRDKHKWRNYPCFWFEVTPTDYSMGVGFFAENPAVSGLLRSRMRENPGKFLDAAEKCEKQGAVLIGAEYKKMPAGCPEGLERFYTHKDLGFIIESGNLEDIADDRIIGIIRKNFKAFSSMYLYLLDIVEEYNSEVKE